MKKKNFVDIWNGALFKQTTYLTTSAMSQEFGGFTIRCAARSEAKTRSKSWEKVDIPGSRHHWIYTHVVRYINIIILKEMLNEGFRVLNRI